MGNAVGANEQPAYTERRSVTMADAETLAKLKAARASGVLRVRYGEREITYRSDAELAAAIAAIEEELTPKIKTVVVRPLASKGW
jgi:hypothetical protein